jgi:amino acid transporter
MSEANKVVKKRHGVKDIVSKRVGVFPVVGMFYAMCCAGAFGVEEMIPESGPGLTIIMLVVLPFVWALPYSYICAELGSARPVEGGNIIWVKEALGEFWFGIMVIVNFIWGLIANTEYVVLAVQYLGQQIELNSYQAYAIKVGLILIFFVINVLGIKEVSLTSTILSIAVVGAFIMVAVVGFANMSTNPMSPIMSDAYDGNVFMTLGASLGIGLWMYSGFDEISLTAGEIKDSYRVIPKALMIVIPLMILTYVLPTLAGLGSVGEWQDWTTEPDGVGYHTVLTEFAPPVFAVIFIIVAIIGQCAIYNMCVAVGARSALIMSDEHFGPRVLAKLTRKGSTPWVSLVVVLVVTWALLGTPNHPLTFQFLVLVDVFFTVIVCALTVISAIILKRRIPPEDVPFKAPGGKPMHNIMAGLCLFFCVAIVLLNGADYFLGGFVIMLLIPILYIICKWIWKGATINDPINYPVNPKTKLGFGDIKKLGGYFAGFGLFGVFVKFFISWYEADWGPSMDFTDEAELLDWGGYDNVDEMGEDYTLAPLPDGGWHMNGYYEDQYGSGFFGNFDSMMNATFWIAIGAVVVGVVLLAIGRKIDRKNVVAA